MEPHVEALGRAKIGLMDIPDTAFFSSICFNLKHVWDTKIPTACTNGLTIRFNPDFFMSLDSDERVFLLAHETCHVAYQHMFRGTDLDQRKFNIAADHVINLMLIQKGMKMPSQGLADPIYTGKSTEEVYALLPDNPNGPCDMDVEYGEGDVTADQQEVENIIVQASIQSRMQEDAIGTIPGEIQLYIDKLLDPKLPWNRILSKHYKSYAKNDYSFRKPNRRYFPKYILPSMHSESLIDLAVAVDISGSVTDHEFKVFVSEFAYILKSLKPNKITILQFDTSIRSVTSVKNLQELSKVTFTGRGGTYIEPVFEWMNENKPVLTLIFTDGGFRFHSEMPKLETIWLINNNWNFTAPAGKVIHYEI